MLTHEKQIHEYEELIARLKEQNVVSTMFSEDEIKNLEIKLDELKRKTYAALSPWERVGICRHAQRPKSLDYLDALFEDSIELFGDRLFRDDPAIICRLAKIGGKKVMVIGQEKGKDTESRLYRNFGMPHPEGYRKALRCMKLAEKFQIPVITLLDTPGAYPGLAAEERGQGWAIATNLLEMARLKTCVIVLLIGEGCSGGALGMGVGDEIAMLEHAYYSVISPEGCASILWKDTSKNAQAAASLKMQAEDLKGMKIVDTILPEPAGGAHTDPSTIFNTVKNYLIETLESLEGIPSELLLERRYQKFRAMGMFTTQS